MTVEFKVAVVAHCPPLGVKEYVELEELFTEAGDQVPEIPLLEVVANNGAVWPAQNGDKAVNAGVAGAFTVIVIAAVVAHKPIVGVNV